MAILILDIGSSSVRALLFDETLRLIPGALVSRPHQFDHDPPGAATLDMDDLQSSVESCIDEILRHPRSTNIHMVGVDTLVGNMLGVDAKGKAVTPVYTYADTRSSDDVALLAAKIDREAAHQRTGCLLHTAYQPGRIHWLKRTQPALYASVARWVDIGAYLYGRWFGEAVTSYSVASWSGLLNRSTLDWDTEWLRLLGLERRQLPKLDDYSNPRLGLSAIYANRWNRLVRAPFCLPVGDGAAANVGSGCVGRDLAALTVGTTAAVRTLTATAPATVPKGLWSYRADAKLHLIGGATTEGGSIHRWVRDTFRLPDDADIEAALQGRLPDGHGLTFLPLLAGERSPGWASNATGAINGLRPSTTPLDILQAALESVALRLSLIAQQMHGVTSDSPTFVGSGGALLASPVWTQMMADALNAPIHMTAEPEITARGVGLLALRAAGGSQLTDYPPAISRTFEPKTENVERLASARERQVAFYNRLYAPS